MLATEMTYSQISVGMPKFLRDKIQEEAAKNARSITGEIVFRLAQTFGIMPDGSAAAAPHVCDANAGAPGVTAAEPATDEGRE